MGPGPVDTQGIDTTALNSFFAEAGAMPMALGVAVQRNGELVRQQFFNGSSTFYRHDVRSVTKSVISILIGIAIEEGFIPSVDEPIGTYLQPLVEGLREEVASIPIRSFLMMGSGLEWHELDGGTSYSDWVQSEDMLQFVVDLPLIHGPGERFIYNTGASHLLSVVLTEATGMATADFAQQYLFTPLGIQGIEWLQDNRGYDTGGMGLSLTIPQMVRLGQLFLNDGEYNGTRVVPSEWISESTTPLLPTGTTVSRYGYLWWLGTARTQPFFLASGYGGQFIFIHPGLELVVVIQQWWSGIGWNNADAQWFQTYQLIVNTLLPGVQ
jgi:CubicO group peptidase (beta-lactamase class C family)